MGKSAVTPTTQRTSMVIWLKDNILALLLVIVSGVGTYTLAINRITVLEVKMTQQESRNTKTDQIIENNTSALHKLAVLLARKDEESVSVQLRLQKLEDE